MTGRDCRSHIRPSMAIAHSTSCGPPNAPATSADKPDEAPQIAGATARARRRARSRAPSRRCRAGSASPSTSPLTSGSGPPSTADTTRRSLRPVTGSTPNNTPPYRGSINGCTSTAMGDPATPACTSRVEHRLHRGDERVEASDADHRIEPAGHRGGRGVFDHRRAPRHQPTLSPPASMNASRTAGCSPTRAPPSTAAENAVVSTTPANVSNPATAAADNAAALLPVNPESSAATSRKLDDEDAHRPHHLSQARRPYSPCSIQARPRPNLPQPLAAPTRSFAASPPTSFPSASARPRPVFFDRRGERSRTVVGMTPEEIADLVHLRRARDLMDRDYAAAPRCPGDGE